MVPPSRSSPAPSRRDFLRAAATAATALSFPRLARAASPAGPIPIIGSAESFRFLETRELAQFASVAGWTGLEASVRKAGQIDPSHVRDDLPDFFNAVQQHGLDMPALATDLFTLRDPDAEGVLRTAAKLGIKRVRLGTWKYDAAKPRDPQLAIIVRDLRELGQLAKEIDIKLGVENALRSDRFGSDVRDLVDVIKQSGQDIGIYFNPARAILVHGSAAPQAALAESRLMGAYAEDYLPLGLSPNHQPKACELGMGVSQPAFFKDLRASGFGGIVCIRYEYALGKNEAILKHARTDLATLQQWLGQYSPSPFL
ncbi:MAG TPA: TIM barrel protein [Opitutaceae bacterium]|jgi:sugar phosphate isomerase/epimerase